MSDSQTQTAKSAILSPLDQLNCSFYLRCSLVFHANNINKAISSLAEGLSSVTTALPYLKGRVICEDGVSSTTQPAISWSPNDPDLILRRHPMANTLPSLAKMKEEGAPVHYFSDDLYPIATFIDTATQPRQPVFEATYAPIEGGLVLNMCVHHGVMDGQGLAILTGMWAFFTRQKSQNESDMQLTIKLPDPDEPLARTTRLIASANRSLVDRQADMETIHRYRNDRILEGDSITTPLPIGADIKKGSRIFTFSVDKLTYAKEVLATRGDFTTNSILSAVIWCSVTRMRLSRRPQRPPTSFSRFSLLVDGRQRLGSAINEPGPYLGNVVLTSSADVPLDVLETSGICSGDTSITAMAPIVQALSDAAARVDTNHISGFLSTLGQIQDPKSLGVGYLSRHQVDFISSSWANLPLYECDFGNTLSGGGSGEMGGTPLFVRYPYTEYADSNMIVLPRRRTSTGKDEVIEVCLMLAENDIEALERDVGFGGWLKL